MYFLRAINSDRQTRLLNVLGQIAMILGDKKNLVVQNCHGQAKEFHLNLWTMWTRAPRKVRQPRYRLFKQCNASG